MQLGEEGHEGTLGGRVHRAVVDAAVVYGAAQLRRLCERAGEGGRYRVPTVVAEEREARQSSHGRMGAAQLRRLAFARKRGGGGNRGEEGVARDNLPRRNGERILEVDCKTPQHTTIQDQTPPLFCPTQTLRVHDALNVFDRHNKQRVVAESNQPFSFVGIGIES